MNEEWNHCLKEVLALASDEDKTRKDYLYTLTQPGYYPPVVACGQCALSAMKRTGEPIYNQFNCLSDQVVVPDTAESITDVALASDLEEEGVTVS